MAKLKSPKITNGCTEQYIKIYFDDVLHICLKQDQVIGFHPFINRNNMPSIKFYTASRAIVITYGDLSTRNEVLQILEN